LPNKWQREIDFHKVNKAFVLQIKPTFAKETKFHDIKAKKTKKCRNGRDKNSG
jgi:hypothetical protein